MVVFAGTDRANNAVRAAMEMSWFIQDILKPKVDGYMKANRELSNIGLSFGIGVDMGTVLVVRGGFKGENNNDLVWVGNATNYAVKLSNVTSSNAGHVRVMESVYKALNDNLTYHMQQPFVE